MLIPLGHEGQTVRRLPWVTFSLIALNLVVFLGVGRTAGEAEERIVRSYEAARAYWFAHPYLVLRPELKDALGRELGPERFETLAAAMNSPLNPPPSDPQLRSEEQQELDRLCDGWAEAASAHPYGRWGLVPSRPELLALLTCMFMHAGWLHLLGNMFILYLAGPSVEDAWGRPLFAAFYLLSGLAASLTHLALHPASDVPLVGASGAIAGIMGAFLIRFTRTRIRFFYWFGFVFRGTFSAPAWLMLPLWLLEQAWMGSLSTAGDSVAYWAHVGGFAFGAAAAWLIRASRIEERFIHPRIEAAIGVASHPAIERGMDLIAHENFVGAREAFAEALAADPRDAEAHLGMWESFRLEGNPAAGVEHIVRVLEHDLRAGERGLAVSRWREMREAGVSAPAALRFRLASTLVDAGDAGDGTEVLRELADEPGGGLLAAKAAGLLADLAPDAGERERWHQRAKGLQQPEPGTPPRGAGQAPPRDVAAAPHPGAPPALKPTAGPIAAEPRSLRRLHPSGLLVATPSGEEVVRYDQIVAVGVAGIADGPRPYVVIDLLLRPSGSAPARDIRLLGSEFDPRTIMERPDLTPFAAFRELVALVGRASRAEVRPRSGFLDGEKLPTFASLAEYERALFAPGR